MTAIIVGLLLANVALVLWLRRMAYERGVQEGAAQERFRRVLRKRGARLRVVDGGDKGAA